MNIKEKSCGVIVVLRKDNNEDKFLIIQQASGHWGFPKGHIEEGETSIETAMRELVEETGITEIEFAKLPRITDFYIVNKGDKKYDKTVEYFVAFATDDKVTIQEKEIQNYKWATCKEALEIFIYKETKQVLDTAQKYLDNMIK
jgi:tRNA nucleotidyltransferase (CCA-adding enzyme)